MKKIFSFLAFTAVIITSFSSCNKDDNTSDNSGNTTVPTLNMSSLSAFVVDKADLVFSLNVPAPEEVSFSLNAEPSEGFVLNYPERVTIAKGSKSKTVTAVADASAMEPGEYSVTFTVSDIKNARAGESLSTTLAFSIVEDFGGAWSVIGKFNEWNADVAMSEAEDGWYESKGVMLTGVGEGFKFRRDAAWSVNLGLDGDAALVKPGEFFSLKQDGGNILLAEDGVYDIYLNPTYKLAHVEKVDSGYEGFSALYLGDKEVASWYKFDTPVDLSAGYTYLFHVYLDAADGQQRIGDFSDANEGFINMLRFGERDRNFTELEWWVGGSSRQKIYGAGFGVNEWNAVALVASEESCVFYLNGDEVGRWDGNIGLDGVTFQAIEFANSWVDSYRTPFNGRIAYVSVWDKPLSKADVMNNIFAVPSGDGLAAFWPMTEGEGCILHEASGNEYGDVDFSTATRVNAESDGYVSVDVSEHVQWKDGNVFPEF